MTEDDRSHEQMVERVRGALSAHDPAPDRMAAMRATITSPAQRGATTLRGARTSRRPWIAAAVAAAAMLVLFALVPSIDRTTTVSAAEILGRSKAALAAPITGIEVLTYDLGVDGVLTELLPAEQTGRLAVEELIDHDHAGRYRLLKLGSDGSVVAGIADDPVLGTRARYIRANGRGYLLRFTGVGGTALSFPALKRTFLQAFITLMQAEAEQNVATVTCAGESCYEITVPDTRDTEPRLISLTKARAVITSGDARIVEFSASGTIADRPFGIDFTLKSREVRPGASASDADFDIAPREGDVLLHGDGSSNPAWDVIERALAAIPAPPR